MDGVIEGLDVTDLATCSVPDKRNMGHFKLKSGMETLPVLRGHNFQSLPQGTEAHARILTVNKLEVQLKQLGLRAGYEDDLQPYSFRRGQANKFDGKHKGSHPCFWSRYLILIRRRNCAYCGTTTAHDGAHKRKNILLLLLRCCEPRCPVEFSGHAYAK